MAAILMCDAAVRWSMHSRRTWARRAGTLVSMCVATAACPTSAVAQPGVAGGVDLLMLTVPPAGAMLPDGWETRAVRRQRLPEARVVDSAGLRFLRLSGQGQAGWFVRRVPAPIAPAPGRLHWTWRAPLAPRGADLGVTARDDAALRLFVVFDTRGLFARRPRVIFYSLGDGDPPAPTADAPVAVRVATRPAAARDWTDASADPFADYRRIWGRDAPPIVAIGLMQDTDQTRTPAVGEVQTLQWRRDDAARP